MKKSINLLLSIVIVFNYACGKGDKGDDISEFILAAEVANKQTLNIVIDNAKRKISFDLAQTEKRTDVNIKLTLAEGVSMMSPATPQADYDLTTAAKIILSAGGRTIVFDIIASDYASISEVILAAEVTNRQARNILVNNAQRSITFDLASSESKIGVDISLTLADGVSMVSPATPQAVYNLIHPAQIQLSAEGQIFVFTVGIGIYEPDIPTEVEIKVMSFNVRYNASGDGNNIWNNRRNAVIAMIADQKPHIMGVQEPRQVQKDFLDQYLTGYLGIGLPRNNASNAEYTTIYYLEKELYLEQWGNFWLSETPDRMSVGWDAGMERNLTWAVFTHKKSGKQFFVMNTHLDNSGSLARNQSMQLIVSKMAELNTDNLPVLLAGDFNTSITNSIFSPTKSFMSDARTTALVTDNKDSYNGFGLSKSSKLDHILYSTAHFIPIRFRVIDDNYGVPYISDHYPIMATLKFK